jgi:hypothetical protein
MHSQRSSWLSKLRETSCIPSFLKQRPSSAVFRRLTTLSIYSNQRLKHFLVNFRASSPSSLRSSTVPKCSARKLPERLLISQTWSNLLRIASYRSRRASFTLCASCQRRCWCKFLNTARTKKHRNDSSVPNLRLIITKCSRNSPEYVGAGVASL